MTHLFKKVASVSPRRRLWVVRGSVTSRPGNRAFLRNRRLVADSRPGLVSMFRFHRPRQLRGRHCDRAARSTRRVGATRGGGARAVMQR